MEDKYKNWEITSNRFVAFIDIMGFKDIVQRKSSTEIYTNLLEISKVKNELINDINNLEAHTNDISGLIEEGAMPFFLDMQNTVFVASFSDSIILFSKDNYLPTLLAFQCTVISIFANIIKLGWGAKGAISYGNMTVDIKNSIYFGQPLIDAFLLQENELHYYGMVLHNTAEDGIKKISEKANLPFSFSEHPSYFYCDTPMKSGKINHLNIECFSGLLTDYDMNYLSDINKINFIREKLENLYLNVSGAPRKYVDNTLGVFDEYIKYYNKYHGNKLINSNESTK